MPALPLTVASLVVGLAVSASMLKAWRYHLTPQLHGVSSPFMQQALARCPTAQAPYSVNAVLANRHVETILASQLRSKPGVRYLREMLSTDDGGTITIDTEDSPAAQALPADTPIILILPGLTGGSHDSYVQHMVLNARRAGFRAVVFNSRATSDSPVTSAQFYSASFTGDLKYGACTFYTHNSIHTTCWCLFKFLYVAYTNMCVNTARSSSTSQLPTQTHPCRRSATVWEATSSCGTWARWGRPRPSALQCPLPTHSHWWVLGSVFPHMCGVRDDTIPPDLHREGFCRNLA